MARPAKYPEWAVDDVVNPTSGQNNVSDPDLSDPNKKLLGWDFKEFPPRQWFNWLQRTNYQWFEYFDQDVFGNTLSVESRALTVGSVNSWGLSDLDINSFAGMNYFSFGNMGFVSLGDLDAIGNTISFISTLGIDLVGDVDVSDNLDVGGILNTDFIQSKVINADMAITPDGILLLTPASGETFIVGNTYSDYLKCNNFEINGAFNLRVLTSIGLQDVSIEYRVLGKTVWLYVPNTILPAADRLTSNITLQTIVGSEPPAILEPKSGSTLSAAGVVNFGQSTAFVPSFSEIYGVSNINISYRKTDGDNGFDTTLEWRIYPNTIMYTIN